MADDFSECHDLAEQEPDKLKEMTIRWWFEASKYNVLPLDDRLAARMADPRPGIGRPRDTYTYFPHTSPVPTDAAARTIGRSYSITAHVDIPDGGAEGVLLAQGAFIGGVSLFVQHNYLVFVHNYVGIEEYRLTSDDEVPKGKSELRFEFAYDGGQRGAGGTGTMYINGKKAGEGRIPRTCPISYSLSGEGLCCGWDSETPVSKAYKSPFKFTGTIEKVVMDVSGEVPERKPAEEAQMALTRD